VCENKQINKKVLSKESIFITTQKLNFLSSCKIAKSLIRILGASKSDKYCNLLKNDSYKQNIEDGHFPNYLFCGAMGTPLLQVLVESGPHP
jgi:hypothetical protein